MVSDALSAISLDAAGLVALADLVTVARRTALTGTSALLDCLVLCPGLHRQQDAPKLNSGEYPICAAMTTGYVFRIENQATVAYLQEVGRTGQLTTLSVSPKPKQQSLAIWCLAQAFDWQSASRTSALCYFACVALTAIIVSLLISLRDWWALFAVGVLVFARLVNLFVLRRRAVQGWKGEPEAHAHSDLIVLVSRDRWIRIRGDVNDVKAVTSGEWLRDPTVSEKAAVAFATLMVYLDAALAGNGGADGKLLLLVLLFGSAGLLGLCNEYTEGLKMYDRTIEISGPRRRYRRRLHLAEQLFRETAKTEWALKLGMLNEDDLTRLRSAGDKGGPGDAGHSPVEKTGGAQHREVIKEL